MRTGPNRLSNASRHRSCQYNMPSDTGYQSDIFEVCEGGACFVFVHMHVVVPAQASVVAIRGPCHGLWDGALTFLIVTQVFGTLAATALWVLFCAVTRARAVSLYIDFLWGRFYAESALREICGENRTLSSWRM